MSPTRSTQSTTTPTARQSRVPGRVAFVGAGPGDSGLMTVRSLEFLAAADVVVIDRDRVAWRIDLAERIPRPMVLKGADRLGALATARLAGQDDVDPALPQGFGETPDLGGLADPLPAFERDEAPPSVQGSHPNRSSPAASSARACSEPRPTAAAVKSGVSWISRSPLQIFSAPTFTPAFTGAMIGPRYTTRALSASFASRAIRMRTGPSALSGTRPLSPP